jgi:hypothetical protein
MGCQDALGARLHRLPSVSADTSQFPAICRKDRAFERLPQRLQAVATIEGRSEIGRQRWHRLGSCTGPGLPLARE